MSPRPKRGRRVREQRSRAPSGASSPNSSDAPETPEAREAASEAAPQAPAGRSRSGKDDWLLTLLHKLSKRVGKKAKVVDTWVNMQGNKSYTLNLQVEPGVSIYVYKYVPARTCSFPVAWFRSPVKLCPRSPASLGLECAVEKVDRLASPRLSSLAALCFGYLVGGARHDQHAGASKQSLLTVVRDSDASTLCAATGMAQDTSRTTGTATQ